MLQHSPIRDRRPLAKCRAGLTRRQLGKLAGMAAAAAALPACTTHREPSHAAPPATPPPPNLLLILGDDLGWADLGSYGSTTIRHSASRRVGVPGLRFTDGYAAAPVCSPTRLACTPAATPVDPPGLEEPIGSPDPRIGLPPDHPSLASLLRPRGYSTAMLGKWHCGYLPEYSPIKSGWDEFFGNYSGGVDYYSKINYNGDHDLYEREVEVESLAYYTETLAERAVEFLGRDHTRPWLLDLNFTSPHWPWEAPGDTAWSRKVTQRMRDANTKRWTTVDRSRPTSGWWRASTLRSVRYSTRSAPPVRTPRRWSGSRRITVASATRTRGRCGDASSSSPREESGYRRSCAGRGDRAGRVSHEPVITQDWTAIFLELAGANPSADYPLDGRSLVGHLATGAPVAAGDLFWRTHEAGVCSDVASGSTCARMTIH